MIFNQQNRRPNMAVIAYQQKPAKGRKLSWITVGLVALATVMLAGCSTSTDATAVPSSPSRVPPTPTIAEPATPAAADGVEAAIGDVPWSKVGPGWMLALWNPVTPRMPGTQRDPDERAPGTAATTLYLVDPAGNRYAITNFADDGKGEPELIDWSGDGSHALLEPNGYGSKSVISIDLHTAAQTMIPIKGYARYSRPDGKALLVSTGYNGNQPGTLKRIDFAGAEEKSYPTDQLGGAGQFSGGYLESPDGRQLVLGTANLGNEVVPRTDNSLVVMDNEGKIVRTLPSPMSTAQCSPVRWWTSTVILAHCTNKAGSQLWKVPLDGGAPTALTAANSGQEDDPGFGGDIDDSVAYQLPSGTFLQSTGACGTLFLSRLTPDMHTTRVNVPGVSDSIAVAGVTGDKLLLLAKVGCGGTTSLLTYDPAANTSTVLLGPPVNGGGVTGALLYRDQK
jgi:TolB protein